MGNLLSLIVPSGSPLGCLLENFKSLKLMPHFRTSKLTHLCNKIWTQYSLDNGSKWPLNVTVDLIILWAFLLIARSLVNRKRSFMFKHLSTYARTSLCATLAAPLNFS